MTDDKLLTKQLRNPATRHAAFTQVVNQYKEQLYWQIRRMILCHEDTDDVLQNTFMKAWQALDTFRGDAQLSTWLYRIAANETLNHIEKQKRQGKYISNNAGEIATQLESDPYFNGDETERQLQQAIAQLPERQRQVFLLKYYEELKYEDMSQMLDTSVGALKASYHHAVKKISDFFQRND